VLRFRPAGVIVTLVPTDSEPSLRRHELRNERHRPAPMLLVALPPDVERAALAAAPDRGRLVR
jgi:hypothetical protein